MNKATARNIRVQNRYDELMTIGRHGHYETMFRIVREEVELAEAIRDAEIAELVDALEQLLDDMGDTGHCVCEAAKQYAKAALAATEPKE